MTVPVANTTNPNTARCSTRQQLMTTGASTGMHQEGRRAMLVILALIILVIFDVWTLNEMRKHEIAIIELLKKNGMITRRDTDDD